MSFRGAIRPCCKCSQTLEIHAHDMCRLCYDRENADKIRAQRRRYYERHRDRVQARHRAYYHANRERCRAQQKEYRERGKEILEPAPVRVPVKGWGVRA